MKKGYFFIIIISMAFNYGLSQEKQNEMIFVEFVQGVSFHNGESDTSNGFELNYQENKDLFSIRFINNDFKVHERGSIGFFQPYVIENGNEKLDELSMLFGKRIIRNGHSYSVSVGVSYNLYDYDFTQTVDGSISETINESNNFVGVPYELNIKWFSKGKSRPKTSKLDHTKKSAKVGHKFSVGCKVFGNVAAKSYWGLGITLGIGNHKIYQKE